MQDLKILTIIAEPYAGSDIDDCKKQASKYSKENRCQLQFTHNSTTYISDDEGNVAKINKDYLKGEV